VNEVTVLTSYHKGPIFDPCQSLWNVWWTKWH